MAPITNERKFTAPAASRDRALALLDHVALPDPKYPAGIVHSVYFDTPWNEAYEDKNSGAFLKSKVRFRWYSPEPGDAAETLAVYLEIKDRFGTGRAKRRWSQPLDRAFLERAPLEEEGWTERLHALAGDAPLPRDLSPRVALVYRRHRYLCPVTGARICLDDAIRSERHHGGALPGAAGVVLDRVVFEIKDVGQIDLPWLHALYRAGFRSRSFSKYGECMRSILNGGSPG